MLDEEQQTLLSRRISELPLKIEGTRLEELIAQLYRELERAGISIKPRTYLSDGWGCPNRVPVIGIPFYLVDPKLCNLKGQLTGIEAEGDAEVMMILRHEAGHAFNYAYRIYNEPEWRELFGRFSLPYRERYRVLPFSARFVRHLPGWYVQKHPDDDFAETFAVWLTPGSDWHRRGRLDFPDYWKLTFDLAKKYNKRVGFRIQMRAPDYSEEALPDFVLEKVPLVKLVGEWRTGLTGPRRKDAYYEPGMITRISRKLTGNSMNCWRQNWMGIHWWSTWTPSCTASGVRGTPGRSKTTRSLITRPRSALGFRCSRCNYSTGPKHPW